MRRRGACPTLSEPMQTGDGLLVRFASAERFFPPRAFEAIAALALRFGSGIMEVSSRGNLQIRELTAESAIAFARSVGEIGLDAQDGGPIDVGPLAGLDPTEIADAGRLAERVRAVASFEGLGPKVSVVLDGGGRVHLGEVGADVRLTAVREGPAIGWLVALSGDGRTAEPLGLVGEGTAPDVVRLILAAIAELGPQARAKDLDVGVLRTTLADRLVEAGDAQPPFPKAEPIGLHPLRSGALAAGIGLPFGYADARTIAALAQSAGALGASSVRLAPGSALLVVGLDRDGAEDLRSMAQGLGLVTARGDPRRSLSACAGAGFCASGALPTRPLAARIAADHADFLDGSVGVHLSGCTKGCAHAGAADLTLVGADGSCALVLGGRAADRATARTDRSDAGEGFRRLAEAVRAERLHGETSAACLARIGSGRLAAAFEARP